MNIVKSDFKVGDRVSHPTLGEGDILDLYPHGEEVVAVISFEKWGQKKIVMSYVKLTVVEVPKVEEKAKDEDAAKKPRKTAKKAVKKATRAKKTTSKNASKKKKKTKKAKKK
jgi:hypothetical protein